MSSDATMQVGISLSWSFGPGAVQSEETKLIEMLKRIARTGSIASAARQGGISYRNAWGMLARWEAHFGHPLLVSERGLGTRLTPFGKRLVELDARIRDTLGPNLEAAAQRMADGLSDSVDAAPQAPRLRASHDLALALLPELMARHGHPIDLQFLGSVDSLAAFAEGRCEIAGFHCPEGPIGASLWQQYQPYLRPRQHVLLRLVRRTQGILVQKGNPKRLRGIEDLTRPGVRFLNRQAGAGTRLLLDWLLQERHIGAGEITGYGNVEMTHSAVAAMIASGHADAGLGVEAAARRFGLGFVPLLREDYYLVTRKRLLRQRALQSLVKVLVSEEFRQAVRALPGYDVADSGAQLSAPARGG